MLLEAGGSDGFLRIQIRPEVNDPSVPERPDVGKGHFELDAGVPGPPSASDNGDEPVARADDFLQLNCEFVERLDPARRRACHTLVAAIRLANVVGQDGVLVADLGIEERNIGLAPAHCLEKGEVAKTFQERSKALHVLL